MTCESMLDGGRTRDLDTLTNFLFRPSFAYLLNMVMSKKKLKQKLQDTNPDDDVFASHVSPNQRKSSLIRDPKAWLQELIVKVKENRRSSKREKRRKKRSPWKPSGEQIGIDDGKSKDDRKYQEDEGGFIDKKDTRADMDTKKKKQKRVDEETRYESPVEEGLSNECDERKKKMKNKKKKHGAWKGKIGVKDGEETATAQENGESQMNKKICTKIYVGGIPYYSTEEDIRNYFESYGTILEVDCMRFSDSGRFRGIAIINFKTEAAAKRALELDGSDMGGFFLKIQPYDDKAIVRGRSKGANFAPAMVKGYHRIYVGNLSWDVTEDNLREFFSDCNTTSICLGTDKETGEFRGYGHVNFSDDLSLLMALKLDQQVLCGRPVKVSCAVHKGQAASDLDSISMPVTCSLIKPEDSGLAPSCTGKIKRRTCYNCGKKGHISSACSNKQNLDSPSSSAVPV